MSEIIASGPLNMVETLMNADAKTQCHFILMAYLLFCICGFLLENVIYLSWRIFGFLFFRKWMSKYAWAYRLGAKSIRLLFEPILLYIFFIGIQSASFVERIITIEIPGVGNAMKYLAYLFSVNESLLVSLTEIVFHLLMAVVNNLENGYEYLVSSANVIADLICYMVTFFVALYHNFKYKVMINLLQSKLNVIIILVTSYVSESMQFFESIIDDFKNIASQIKW